MALFAAARRTAASSLPLLRASDSASGASLLRALAAAAARPRPRAMPFWSAPVTKPSSDGELFRIFESEIKYAEESYDHGRERVPDNFPFEILDEEGMSVVILKRDYKDEKIEVIVSMPNLEGGPEYDDEDGEDNEDEDEYEDESDGVDDEYEDESAVDCSRVSLKVTVSKGSGPKLEFTCTAFREKIIINEMLIAEKADAEEEKFPYEGPEFTELPVHVQKGLFKFLEERGITLPTTIFMHDYMVTKQTKAYVRWMTKLKDFVRQ